MSGGSFSYLYRQDSNEIFALCPDRDEDEGDEGLVSMRNVLRDRYEFVLGGAEALARTEELITTIRATRAKIDAMMADLKDVFQAVEWCFSGDSGDDDVWAALRRYAARTIPSSED